MKKIVYLSGGIGGAKLAKGFYNLNDIDFTIIVNTGDDETIHGVRLSPDIDSVIYALAEIEGRFGWGQKNDTFSVSEEYKKYLPQEFNLGDKDLALNLFRNQLFSEGKSLTQITNIITDKFDLNCKILPMTDNLVSTKIKTTNGKLLDFQEYFVELKSEPKISEVIYLESEKADTTEEVSNALDQADKIVVGPSNPILSIGPILAIQNLKEKLTNSSSTYVVSPFIENKAIKGPSKKNFEDLGYKSDITGIKKFYNNIGNYYIVQSGDTDKAENTIEKNILLKSKEDSTKLARYIVDHE
ncbi:2-phospho-L-lactate transferase [Acidimicrobiaceae bacterium]|nr:2-phospho-L-lactate transferase [Acidimicrobiaceae bacterium]